MSDQDQRRVFAFPANPTRRERLTFSKHAGMTLQQLEDFFDDDNPDAMKAFPVEAEAALILMAAQRVDSSITFDDCLDHDDWVLGAPEEAAPLAPPASPPATNESPSSPT